MAICAIICAAILSIILMFTLLLALIAVQEALLSPHIGGWSLRRNYTLKFLLAKTFRIKC